MKEILCEITFSQVYGKEVDNKSTGPLFTFYTNGTYMVWQPNFSEKYPSLWKIIDGVMWVKHTYNAPENHEWVECSNNAGSYKITAIVASELAIEQLLTEET